MQQKPNCDCFGGFSPYHHLDMGAREPLVSEKETFVLQVGNTKFSCNLTVEKHLIRMFWFDHPFQAQTEITEYVLKSQEPVQVH